MNKRIIRTPFPIPKISTALQELEGFTFATALDSSMGYYNLTGSRRTEDVHNNSPLGDLRLPIGISGSPDIFEEKMTNLMEELEYVRTYINDLLVITNSTFDDHLQKVEVVLNKLRKANLRCNAPKCGFALQKNEYLGYSLSRDGIAPQPEKVSAVLALTPPKNVKELRRFLGMVQYYRDVW